MGDDRVVELVLHRGVFVARLDIRVVVDLNHQRLAVHFFQVDAVQALADELGALQRDLFHGWRHFVIWHGLYFAVLRGLAGR